MANDAKWNELITAMRSCTGCRPRYRCKCIDGLPSYWDAEWFYHLPFPVLAIEWLDIAYLQEKQGGYLPHKGQAADHPDWITGLLRRIGLDFCKGTKMIRVFGYSPRNLELFDQ